jgi:uncharacterized membrane protein YfcA
MGHYINIPVFFIAVLFAGIVATVTGFGISTIMVPIAIIFYPPPQALLFVGIIHWFSNIWKLLLFRSSIKWSIIVTFGIPAAVATILGARLMFDIPKILFNRMLGVFLIIYVILILLKSNFRLSQKRITLGIGGVLSGLAAGIFGMGGAIRAMFLAAIDLPKAVYISTVGAASLFVDTSRLVTYIYGGSRLNYYLIWAMPLFVTASAFGAYLGKHVVEFIPQKYFRKIIVTFLLIVGLILILTK